MQDMYVLYYKFSQLRWCQRFVIVIQEDGNRFSLRGEMEKLFKASLEVNFPGEEPCIVYLRNKEFGDYQWYMFFLALVHFYFIPSVYKSYTFSNSGSSEWSMTTNS